LKTARKKPLTCRSLKKTKLMTAGLPPLMRIDSKKQYTFKNWKKNLLNFISFENIL
jgi:hypothetical protein